MAFEVIVLIKPKILQVNVTLRNIFYLNPALSVYILVRQPDDSGVSPPRGRHRARRQPAQTLHQDKGYPTGSPNTSRSNSRDPLYRSTSLETRSRSPSPNPTPTPSYLEYYGSANLTDRSRSPSPSSSGVISQPAARQGRISSNTPQKPSSLNIPLQKGTKSGNNMPHVLPSPTIPQPHKSPGSINFPKLNASPTHAVSPSAGRRRTSTSRLLSPTEVNDLNMPPSGSGSHYGSLGQMPMPRTRSRDQLDRNVSHGGHRKRPMVHSGSHERPLERSRDHRYVDPLETRDDVQLIHGRDRTAQSSNLPNGFKHRQKHHHRSPAASGFVPTDGRHRRGSGAQPHLPAQADNSDSDGEDWC